LQLLLKNKLMLHKSEQKRKTAKTQYIEQLASEPMHIREIAKRLGINWRTAYRMIHELKKDGWAIATTKDHLYYSVTLNDKIKNLKIDKEIRDNGDIVLRCDFNGENRSIKIVKEIYDRLKSKFIMTNIGNISYIDEYIYCLYFRYAYIDADMQQLAIHPKIKIMMKKFGVNFELFGSGINVLSDRYCSLFYDIEKYFGSQGDFISFRVKQGIYWCNPPYINSLMEKCSRKLLDWLENNHNVGFLLTIPVWDKYTQKNIKDKDKVQKNQNINVSQDEFKDYPCYYLIQPYIKYELIIPKYAIPYFSFKYNEYKYAVDTYMLFIYNKLDDKYSKPIIEVFDHIYENYKKELVITY